MAKHLYEQTLPSDACSYWQRQQWRDANENGFGASPYSFMTAEQAEEHGMRQMAEDESDPPCGACTCCGMEEAGDDPTEAMEEWSARQEAMYEHDYDNH